MIYAIMALGVYITYKILDFPDLTVDGSFPLGAAVTVVLISKGIAPVLTLPVCFVIGAFVGMLTGIIHVKLKVRDLLSGIIMMTALYTVNLRIAGKANFPIYNEETGQNYVVYEKGSSTYMIWLEDETSVKSKVHEAIDSKLDGKTIVKEIYVKNKIYNIVVK